MYRNKRILAIVPARGGSQGLPGKNIKLLQGKPLIVYSLDLAKQISLFDEILVSSDSDEILDVAIKNNIKAVKRPSILATNTAKTQDAIKYHLQELLFAGEKYDIIVLLQPTSPFRNPITIEKAITQFIDSDESYTSLMPLHKTSSKVGEIIDGVYIPSVFGEHPRQQLKQLYKECGTIFVYKTEHLDKEYIIGDKIFPFVLDNAIESLEIDTLDDFLLAEAIFPLFFS